MKIRVLGAHNLETPHTKHTCFLIDDILAVDAGSIMSSLESGEKDQLRAILLTHRHFDHVRDLPSLGLQTMENGVTIDLHGLPNTLDAVSSHLMDGLLYPDFTVRPTRESPKYRINPISPNRPFNSCDMEILPVFVPHGAPAVGYIIQKAFATVAFTGDTGGGLMPFLSRKPPIQLIFVEVTFSNDGEDLARASGHLTPSILNEELSVARNRGLPLPRIVAVHRDPRHEEAAIRQLADISKELSVTITPANAGDVFRL